MKLNEIINVDNIDNDWGIFSKDKNILKKYLNEDCIIAFEKNNFGNVFIFKGKNIYFSFFSINKILGKYIYGNKYLWRIPNSKVFELFSDKINILEDDKFSKVRKIEILKNLK